MAMPGFGGVAVEKTEPHVTHWDLQEHALKWSLGMQHVTRDQCLPGKDGGSSAEQKAISQPLGNYAANVVCGSCPT